MSRKLTKISESKAKAVKWLTTKPKSSSTPLENATDATSEVAYGVHRLDDFGSFDRLLEALRTILAAMHTSAGVEYPESIAYQEAPTEEEVVEAYDFISLVDNEEDAFEYLTQNLRRAMDIADRWYSLYHPNKYSDNWEDWYVDDVNVEDEA